MSRIIDNALELYLSGSEKGGAISNDVILYHSLEIIITAMLDSEICKKIFGHIKKDFQNYIYSSCLISKPAPMVGTKIMLYISDNENVQFSNLLEFMSQTRKQVNVAIYLDNKAI